MWKIEEKFHPDSSFDFPVTIFEEKSKEGKIKVVKRKPNSDWFNQSINQPFGEKFSSSPGLGEGTMKSDQEKEKSSSNFSSSSGA